MDTEEKNKEMNMNEEAMDIGVNPGVIDRVRSGEVTHIDGRGGKWSNAAPINGTQTERFQSLNNMDNNSVKIYVVARFYISASDYHSNGHSDCEVFNNKEAAKQLFSTWRKEELEMREETGCDYNIYSDNEEKFHCSWDSDLEMLFILMAEKTIKSS